MTSESYVSPSTRSTLAQDDPSARRRIGWIGTGVMGSSMGGHLLAKGYALTIHTRTKSKADPLLAKGADWADSPREAAAASDIVFTMVGFPQDVRDVYFGERGILAGVKPGAMLIDMTTTDPQLSQDIEQKAHSLGVRALDAPVSGGDTGARNATLSIMVGGEKEALEAVRPLLEAFGKTIVHQGPAGAGQQAKLCNQLVIAGTMIGVCESLLYAAKSGLDPATMLSSIRGGAAGCWTLENLAPRMLKRDFAPGFMVDHFIKDMGLALDESRRMGLSLPGLSLVHQLYLTVQAQDHGRHGTHALLLALESLSQSSQPVPAKRG